MSQFVYFSLVLREREETKTKYSTPQGSFIKSGYDIYKDTIVGSLSLCFNATNIIEKICWFLIGIFGTICMSIVVLDQIESWSLNPIIASRKLIKLSEVDFPAITFCHQGNTRMELAERMLNVADQKDSKVRQLRSLFLKNSVEFMMKKNVDQFSKGQLISKCPFGVIVSTKIPTKKFDNFCPRIFKVVKS